MYNDPSITNVRPTLFKLAIFRAYHERGIAGRIIKQARPAILIREHLYTYCLISDVFKPRFRPRRIYRETTGLIGHKLRGLRVQETT